MNIQPVALSSNNNCKNTLNKNVSFKAVIPHKFPLYPTKETISLFTSPDFHKLAKGLSDVGQDLHIAYRPADLSFDGPCKCREIPEMYDLYYCKKGTDDVTPLTTLVSDKNLYYQVIDVPELMKKVVDKFEPLKDIKVKDIVTYIADGINESLKSL